MFKSNNTFGQKKKVKQYIFGQKKVKPYLTLFIMKNAIWIIGMIVNSNLTNTNMWFGIAE